MGRKLDAFTEKALALPKKEREQLVEKLIHSLDYEHPDWEAELDRRYVAVENGTEKTIEGPDAMREIAGRLKKLKARAR